VCLITGGSSGIGLATARLFASKGYDLAICGRREGKLNEAKQAIRDACHDSAVECMAIVADMDDVKQARSVAEQAIERFRRIDVLVNNAARAPLAPFEEITADEFESTINTNIRSLFYLTQIAWKSMKSQHGGTVVNISSLSAVDPFPGFSLYGACKSWLDIMTLALAEEGKSDGVRVCSVRPGAVETPMLRGLFPEFPAEQCVQPSDIANVVWGCVNEPESYPSGQAFPVTNQS
jgi:NAD(P)-dependent dehydrogenase (short-subunit alcohol dehydrogenase family)